MQTKIKSLLQKLEQEKSIEILYACEAGSRAWGFPSPDSDYDIRFIYRHPRSWYLNLQEKKDTIEFMQDELLDGNGWDMRKVLRLLYKSNASLFEWLGAPIVYFPGDKRITELRQLAPDYFLPAKVMFHYLGIAKGMLEREFKGSEVKIKKYFYVIRPVLTAKWIAIEQKPAPVDFYELLPLVENQKEVTAAIQQLLTEKETAQEGQLIPRVPILDQFIQAEMEQLDQIAKGIERKTNTYDALNDFYRQHILGL